MEKQTDSEVQMMKRQLEIAIEKMLYEFQVSTGYIIDDISLQGDAMINPDDGKPSVYPVHIKISN